MNLVIFMGIQATGKSTFFQQRFAETHVRINLDMLKTRHRENLIFSACLEAKALTVVDNTNLTREFRARYLTAARGAGYSVHGYFFRSRIEEALARNALRGEGTRLPDLALRGAAGQLELPSYSEGFDELSYVSMVGDGTFLVEAWRK
ncbi:kinase [Spartobacteria bacterium LR76]|nr:kinase [Spartobacteria bacterium LR76]